MTQFSVGDRVCVLRGHFAHGPGKIVKIFFDKNTEDIFAYGIEFDAYCFGHNSDGTGKIGHCWNVLPDYIEVEMPVNLEDFL